MKSFHHFLLSFLLSFLPTIAGAQKADPVHFSVEQHRVSPTEIELIFSATIDEGWHIYSSDIDNGGPTRASLQLDKAQGLLPKGKLQPQGNVKEQMDELFQMQVRYFEHQARFSQRFTITQQEYVASGHLEYGACSDQNCLPPAQVPFSIKGSDGPAPQAAAKESNLPSEDTLSADTTRLTASPSSADTLLPAWWAPVGSQMQPIGSRADSSLWWMLLMGLLGGLVAVLTPCVWPVIPMTISYFLKREGMQGQRGRALRDACLYGLSILIIYVALGLIVTLAFGSNGLNALSTSALFNLVCFAVLVLFAISFMGGFELSLPSSWGNKTDRKADQAGGLLGIFFMALTLTIVSFSCTGPIVGFLLVDLTATAQWLAPVVGLAGFGLGLALPFTLFALFPTLLKKAPRSGGWMNKVKVTLGFVELAFALKFFSVADMAYGWHLLDREVFLSLWIVLAALLGLYLLGLLRFPADENRGHTTVWGLLLALFPLAFAIYLLPGLWGAPLKAVSAFAPPMSTQDFNLYKSQTVEARFTDYDAAIQEARATGKPLLLDFTGFGCVNCRKMEAAVWTHPDVARRLNDDFILVSLHVDDRTPLPAPLTADNNGQQRTLRTVGAKWSFLQSHKFGANTQPFYVIVDAAGWPLAPPYSYDESTDHFLRFLQSASVRRP